jgi:hypothetical protein
MSPQRGQPSVQASQGWLGHDRVHEASDELPQQAPGRRAGQAARATPSAERGESSSASISGSSTRMIKRWAST